MALLTKRRFLPLFITQFFGAFNDNLFKNALVILLTFQAAHWTTLKPGQLTNLAAGVFILPFFIFSATCGQLADKYDKARLARISKILEIAIALFAAAGFYLESLPVLMTALFLLGLQSTLFGPVKYAILPQHLRDNELVPGNALVEAATFVAILLGTLAGGILAASNSGPVWISLAIFVIAAIGYAASRFIPTAPAPEPGLRLNFNPVSETWRCLGYARENPKVFLAVIGISWFWLYGSALLAQFPDFTRSVLGGKESLATLLLTVFAVGIGGGSILCGRLSREKPDLRLTLIGAIGLSVFGFDLAWTASGAAPALGQPLAALLTEWRIWRVLLALLAIGISGGLYGVPLYAQMQRDSEPGKRARVVAANNILNALFMVIASLCALALLRLGASIAMIFFVVALGNAVMIAVGWRMVKRM